MDDGKNIYVENLYQKNFEVDLNVLLVKIGGEIIKKESTSLANKYNIKGDKYLVYNNNKSLAYNPLKYTDPSGELLDPISFLLIFGAVISGFFYSVQALSNDNFSWEGLGQSLLIGGITGFATAGIGAAFGGVSNVFNEIARAVVHGASGSYLNLVFSQGSTNFGSDFLTGAVSSLVGSGISAAFTNAGATQLVSLYVGGALSGGITAQLTGGDFLQGASRGLIIAALNHGLDHGLNGGTSKDQDGGNQKKTMASAKENGVEIINWDKNGDGTPQLDEMKSVWQRKNASVDDYINVDISKIDLTGLYFDDFSNIPINGSKSIDFTFSSKNGNVFGHLTVRNKGGDLFKFYYDKYDFQLTSIDLYDPLKIIGTLVGRIYNGNGTPFYIRIEGFGSIFKLPHRPNFMNFPSPTIPGKP